MFTLRFSISKWDYFFHSCCIDQLKTIKCFSSFIRWSHQKHIIRLKVAHGPLDVDHNCSRFCSFKHILFKKIIVKVTVSYRQNIQFLCVCVYIPITASMVLQVKKNKIKKKFGRNIRIFVWGICPFSWFVHQIKNEAFRCSL